MVDFQAAGIGEAGWWFANFDAPEPVVDRPTGENERSQLPSWVAPLNHFSLDECDLVNAADECLEAFLTRTFSQDGPSRSAGGQPDWDVFTLPDGSVGRSGAIVDPFTAGTCVTRAAVGGCSGCAAGPPVQALPTFTG